MSHAEYTPKSLGGVPPHTLDSLFGVLNAHDPETADHSVNVAGHARSIAAMLGLSREDRELVYVAGLMHDVGKLFLPDHILRGAERLTEDDWELVRRHPEQGAWLVAEVKFPGPLAEVILDHHERLDGSGYPNGLQGGEVSPHARIVSVADSFDAMTSRSTYQRPLSHRQAFAELRRVAGTTLDSEAVEAMVAVARRGRPLR